MQNPVGYVANRGSCNRGYANEGARENKMQNPMMYKRRPGVRTKRSAFLMCHRMSPSLCISVPFMNIAKPIAIKTHATIVTGLISRSLGSRDRVDRR